VIWSIADVATRWPYTPLGSIASKIGSGATPRGGRLSYVAAGVPLIRSQNVRFEGFTKEGLVYLTDDQAKQLDGVTVRPGDVLLNITGASIGRVCVAPPEMDGARVNQHVCIIRQPALHPNFLAAYLASPQLQRDILQGNYGATREALTKSQIVALPVPLVSDEDQAVLVDLIDRSSDRSRSAAGHLGTARRSMDKFRRAVLAGACSGRLTVEWRAAATREPAETAIDARRAAERERLGKRYREPTLPEASELPTIPEGWSWALLSEVGEMGRGRSRHRPRNDPRLYGGDLPFIQTGDVAGSGGRITTHSQTYNERGLAQSRLWPGRTVCITIAANIAESALLTYPACFPDSVVGVICDESVVLPEYLELFIRTARRDLAAFAPATAQANINLAILSEVAVAVPPIDEQREIVLKVGRIYELADRVLSAVRTASRRVERTSQAVLSKALHGQFPLSAAKSEAR
jgi:type I restriction enzyme, S subunit